MDINSVVRLRFNFQRPENFLVSAEIDFGLQEQRQNVCCRLFQVQCTSEFFERGGRVAEQKKLATKFQASCA